MTWRGRWHRAGTNTGEPIEAGVAIGAATDYRGVGWFCPGLEQVDGGGSFTLGFRSRPDGRRDTARATPTSACPTTASAARWPQAPERIPSWFVFDSREGGRLPAIAMPEGDPAEHLGRRHLGAGRHARGAGRAGSACPPTRWSPRVARFNGFCESGVDEDFGRGGDEYDTFFAGGAGPNKALTPCDQAPFYAARFVLSDLGTKGGLVTDAAGRVLREDGSAIPGLYAASNTRRLRLRRRSTPARARRSGSAMVFASLAVRDIAV